MALEDAFQFIQRMRSDVALRDQLETLGDEVSLDQIIDLAATAGWNFSVNDLQKAHKYDWAMRWANYQRVDSIGEVESKQRLLFECPKQDNP